MDPFRSFTKEELEQLRIVGKGSYHKILTQEERDRRARESFDSPEANKKKAVRILDEVTRKKISNTLQGHPVSKETRGRISRALVGKTHTVSKETRESISRALWGRPSPLLGRTMSKEEVEAHKEPWKRLSKREKEEWLRKSFHNPEMEEKRVQGIKRYLASLSEEEMAKRLRKSFLSKKAIKKSGEPLTTPETFLALYLEGRAPKQWAYNGSGEKTSYLNTLGYSGLKRPDFVNMSGRKIVIEVFGTYWHSEDEVEEKIRYYRKFGFDCIVLWDYECYLWEDLGKKLDWAMNKEVQE